MVTVKNVTLNLEEELLFKVLKFAGFTRSDDELERMDESAYEAQRASITSATTAATRYYFGNLTLSLDQVKLSMIKSAKLTPDLQRVKQKLGISLLTFEDAPLEIDPFIRIHPFETIGFLNKAIYDHYYEEFRSQAILVIGTTDILGNPYGLLNDIHEGVSGLSDGNVVGLFKNVAHGAANSTAKVRASFKFLKSTDQAGDSEIVILFVFCRSLAPCLPV